MKKLYTCCLLWSLCLQSVWSSENDLGEISEIDGLDMGIQIGSFKGWGVYLDNQIETDYPGFGLYQIAPLITSALQGGENPSLPSNEVLNEFSEYLTKLFPEIDVERKGILSEFQLTKIFNLVYEINLSSNKSTKERDVVNLSSIKDDIENASHEIEEFLPVEIKLCNQNSLASS